MPFSYVTVCVLNPVGFLGYSKNATEAPSSIVVKSGGRKFFDADSVSRISDKFYASVASNLVANLPSPFGMNLISCSVFL